MGILLGAHSILHISRIRVNKRLDALHVFLDALEMGEKYLAHSGGVGLISLSCGP
jgi:hypothetical protein